MMHLSTIFIFVFIFTSGISFADIINIPADVDSIQGGIDMAVEGDTVLVQQGIYYENINFKGKAITVASLFCVDGDTAHISKTIIDGSKPSNPDSGSVVYFVSAEDTTSVIMGFTITGGTGTYDSGVDGYGGAGIYIFGNGSSGGKIVHNRIVNNNLLYDSKNCGGAGIAAIFTEPDRQLVIEHNEIKNNSIISSIIAQGGGIACKWTSETGFIRISNNIITGNSVTCLDPYKAIGGGILLSIDLPNSANAVVENNLITHNELHCRASLGAGIYVVYWSSYGTIVNDPNPTPLIANNLIYNNYSQDKGAAIGVWTVGLNTSSTITPQPMIINNTLFNNQSNDGCALFNFDCFPLLMNNILWDDLTVENSREVFDDNIDYRPDYNKTSNDGITYIYHSDVQGGFNGEGNIDAYPSFVDTSSNDFSLLESSRCVGNGIDSIKVKDHWYSCPDKDFYGNPRPHTVDEYIDMGAIESSFLINNLFNTQDFVIDKYSLSQNYPNPFNPSTTIEFSLPKSEIVELKVFNILGSEVSTLVSKKLNQGNHTYQFDGRNLASGIYYYQLVAGDPSTSSGQRFREVKKMIMIK